MWTFAANFKDMEDLLFGFLCSKPLSKGIL